MEIIINSLDENIIDNFICQDSDRYARIIRPATDNDRTVDLIIRVRTVAVTPEAIVLDFPNGSIFSVNCSSIHYHKIEVL